MGPHRIPTSSKYQRQQSPNTSPTSSTSRLSGPNVPPGTSVNVSSFSLIQHAKGKKLAASQEKSPKNKKSPESVKKSNKKSPLSKSTNKKESHTSPKISKKRKKEDVEVVGKDNKTK